MGASPGFQGYWALNCSGGDCAEISKFDTEANAALATDRTCAWVETHVRELVVLPPEAMIGAEAEKLA